MYAADQSGAKQSCVLEYALGNPVEMSITCAAFESIAVTSDDLFEALSLIRMVLEERGYLILCNGARTDAYPSRMSRQMGEGGKVYLFKNGRQAERKDLVSMFDLTEFKQVGTVGAQRRAYDAWLGSLG